MQHVARGFWRMASRLEKRQATLAKMARIPKDVRPALRKAIEDGAGEVVAFQKRLVSVRKGKLRESIKYVMGAFKLERSQIAIGQGKAASRDIDGDPDLTATIVAGGKDAYYARWVEFGTQGHSLAKGARVKSGAKQNEGRQHPGTPPKPFFYGPWRASRKKIKSRVTRAVTKAVKSSVQGSG